MRNPNETAEEHIARLEAHRARRGQSKRLRRRDTEVAKAYNKMSSQEIYDLLTAAAEKGDGYAYPNHIALAALTYIHRIGDSL
jgi:hypothetical protein